MVREAYCSHEISKALHDHGFDELCIFKYNADGVRVKAGQAIDEWSNSELEEDECSAPTHQRAVAWFREIYQIHIDIDWRYKYDTSETDDFTIVYFWDISSPIKNIDVSSNLPFDEYGDCIEDALRYVLEKIIDNYII